MNTKAAVVIPVYKNHLSADELVSLKQCFAVLSQYNIIAVKPAALDISAIPGNGAFADVVSFDDSYFASVHGYNRLMLSEEFYSSFLNYSHILIYQLDAFVFTDRLSYWCGLDYDYIGAPWIKSTPYRNIYSSIVNRARNNLYYRFNAKYKSGKPKINRQMENRVGNGGFSLRKVSVFAGYCRQYSQLIQTYTDMTESWFNEDMFWSLEMNRKKQLVKIPPLTKALQFAFETHPERALQLNHNQLPFGCHAWDKHTGFWRPYFKQYGIDI